MKITEEQRKKLLELKLGRNILSQVCEEISRDEDFNDIEIKINGRLVKNPLYLIEKYNEALENGISNFDNEVEECAKN